MNIQSHEDCVDIGKHTDPAYYNSIKPCISYNFLASGNKASATSYRHEILTNTVFICNHCSMLVTAVLYWKKKVLLGVTLHVSPNHIRCQTFRIINWRRKRLRGHKEPSFKMSSHIISQAQRRNFKPEEAKYIFWTEEGHYVSVGLW